MRRLGAVVKAAREPLAVLFLVFVSETAIAQPFYIPSGSMEPTLAIGDYIVAAKFPYGYSRYSVPFALGPQSDTRLMQRMPERGDVVVFRLPRDPSTTHVKRVVGLPGDHVRMKHGQLFLNGRAVPLKPDGSGKLELEDGSQITAARYLERLPGGKVHPILKLRWDGPLDNTAEFVVPPGHLFMMGDDRDRSLDSRVSESDGGVGFVPIENLVGRADLVVGSYDFPNADGVLRSPLQFRPSRLFVAIH